MKAFTLIETMVYLALLSLLMLGSVSLAYTVARRSDHDAEALKTHEEGTFLLQKVAWVIGQSRAVQISPTDVLVRTQSPETNPVRLRYEHGSLYMSTGGAESVVIAAGIQSLSFEVQDGAFFTHVTLARRTYSSVLDLPYD